MLGVIESCHLTFFIDPKANRFFNKEVFIVSIATEPLRNS
jgi:hypothetical protein